MKREVNDDEEYDEEVQLRLRKEGEVRRKRQR